MYQSRHSASKTLSAALLKNLEVFEVLPLFRILGVAISYGGFRILQRFFKVARSRFDPRKIRININK